LRKNGLKKGGFKIGESSLGPGLVFFGVTRRKMGLRGDPLQKRKKRRGAKRES